MPGRSPCGDWDAMIPLLLDALSAYRLTRLVTADVILDGPRDAVVRWSYAHRSGADPAEAERGGWADFAMTDPDAPSLATLLTCRFCAGMWVSLAVVAARRLFPRAWPPLAEALAFSAGAALLAGLED